MQQGVGSGRRDSHRLGNSRYRQAITHLQPKGLAATGWQCIQGSTDPRQVVSSERATVRGQTGVREVEPKLTVGTGLVQAVVLLGPLDVVYEYVSSNSDDPWDELAAAEVELVDRLARGFPRVGRDVVCGRLVNHAGRDERADLGEVRAVQVAEGVPIAGLVCGKPSSVNSIRRSLERSWSKPPSRSWLGNPYPHDKAPGWEVGAGREALASGLTN